MYILCYIILFYVLLQSVKDLMNVMKDKDMLLKIKNNNHQQLLEQLESIIVSLDIVVL